MGLDFFAIDIVFCNTRLEHTHGGEYVKDTWMGLETTIGHNCHYNLFPTVFTPYSRFVSGAKMRNIFHDRVHGTSKRNVVFVVHGDANTELNLAAVNGGS